MNTLLSLINQPKEKFGILSCEKIEDIIEMATYYTDVNSTAKIYGNYDFMIGAIKTIMFDFPSLKISCIDITSPSIDFVIKDNFVLSLVDNEVYIENAWNGNTMFQNIADCMIFHDEKEYKQLFEKSVLNYKDIFIIKYQK